MRLLRFAVLCAVLSGALQASVTAPPKPPPPGWPTADYSTLAAFSLKAELAVFDFGDGKKAFITDSAWLAAFQKQLAAATGKPDSYCFCVAYPIVHLLSGDKELVAIELTHSNKIRFFSAGGNGDFILSPADHETLRKLERTAIPSAVAFPKLPAANHRPQPARLELKL